MSLLQEPRKEKNIVYNISYGDHLICKLCIEEFKKENKVKLRQSAKSSRSLPAHCNICEVSHEYKIENILKLFKSSEGGCCIIF